MVADHGRIDGEGQDEISGIGADVAGSLWEHVSTGVTPMGTPATWAKRPGPAPPASSPPGLLARLLGCVVASLAIVPMWIRAPDSFMHDPELGTTVYQARLGAMVFGAITAWVYWRILYRSAASGVLAAAVIFALVKNHADGVVAPQLTCGGGSSDDSAVATRPCTAIVTGANSGIGLATASLLASQGHTVYLGCRTDTSCAAAAATIAADPGAVGAVHPVPGLELGSVRAVGAWVELLPATLNIDFVINNAGLVPIGKQLTHDGLEVGFGVSHVGHFALLEQLQRRGLIGKGATVVNVASEAARFGAFHDSINQGQGHGDLRGEITIGCPHTAPICVPPVAGMYTGGASLLNPPMGPAVWGSYARAKLANVLFARQLAKSNLGINAVSVHPGMVDTPMSAGIAEPLTRYQPVWFLRATMEAILRPPTVAAAVILRCAALADQVPGTYCNGQGTPLPERMLPPHFRDDALATRLWEVTGGLLAEIANRK